MEIITRSARETRKVARILAEEVVRTHLGRAAIVIALQGELGSGKTTFVQGFATALGIEESVKSPTFVILKVYDVPPATDNRRKAQPRPVRWFRHLIHVDCYRLDSPRELLHLGFRELPKDREAIMLIEWADRARKLIPRDALWFTFHHRPRLTERTITF